MNKTLITTILTLAIVCISPISLLAAQVSPGEYMINTTDSTVSWSAHKVGGGHHGVIPIKSGSVTVAKDKKAQGSVIIDMNGIASLDLSGETKATLENHLKSADFFDVKAFPEATFILEKVNPINVSQNLYRVKGNLAIKGVTMPITFKATITEKDSVLKVVSEEFSINRTRFGVKYGSNLIGTVKNKLISNLFKITINIQATKK